MTIQTNSRGRGLCLYQEVKAGDFVCEYLGEIIDDFELEVRILNTRTDDFYHQQMKNGCWVDARNIGNVSRYVNHSCNPNCELQTWSVGNECRLVIVALKDIDSGVEITIDYNWQPIGQYKYIFIFIYVYIYQLCSTMLLWIRELS